MARGTDHHRIAANLQKMEIIRSMRGVATDTRNFVTRLRSSETHRMFADGMIHVFVFMATDAKIVDLLVDEMRSFTAGVRRMTRYTL